MDDAQVATCIVAGMVAVVAIVSVDVVADGTSVHPLRGWWDRNGGAAGTGTADSRDTEVLRLVPSAAQRVEDRADTCKRDYIPSVGGRCTGAGRTVPGEARKVMRKKRREKWPESYENSLRC